MVHLEKSSEWFANWFDSAYYHILYDHRDENEANEFLHKLCEYLSLPQESHILDLCCGAGRHSRALASIGYKVSGCDLSPNSIEEAKSKNTKNTDFFVHDMRDSLPESYDAVFNLFTSFGYFENLADNLKVLKSVRNSLPLGAFFVLDFMNAEKAIKDMRMRETIIKKNINFSINRSVVNGKITKTIAFEDQGKSFLFQEKVQALMIEDFKQLFQESGFELQTSFGGYDLSPFDKTTSPRLISICKTI